MTDIVERLRARKATWQEAILVMEEAAAEIERLRAENGELLELRDELKKASAQLYPGFNMSRILEVHIRKMER